MNRHSAKCRTGSDRENHVVLRLEAYAPISRPLYGQLKEARATATTPSIRVYYPKSWEEESETINR